MTTTTTTTTTMLTLCGFPLSNYHNKVKMVLLEKGVPFVERKVLPGSGDPDVRRDSPLGKLPFVRLGDGRAICESQVICEYLEAAHPEPRLIPADAYDAAKVRELCVFIELHLELVARELYAEAFFGGQVSDGTKRRVRERLAKNAAAFASLAKFAPHVAGDAFTLADVCAWVSLPLVAAAGSKVLGVDPLAAAGIDWKAHLRLVGARPTAQKVSADRKADDYRPDTAPAAG